MRPIPKKLLIHQAVYKHSPTKDRWGNTVWEEVPMKFVRIEPSAQLKQNKENKEVQLNGILFYDCRNSSPGSVEFQEENLIHFNGKNRKIITVDPIYDNNKLHHYELGLV